MVENISDFFKDIKERLSNPLLSAYLIAWCIFNWKVIIGILLFKSTELKIEGYDSYFDLIKCEVTWKSALLWPLISAVGYVLIFPFVRNGILIIGAWFKTWGANAVLSVSKTRRISIRQYLDLKQKNLKALAEIEEIKNSEMQYQNENTILKQQVQNSDNEKIEWGNLVAAWQILTNAAYFDGHWTIKIQKEGHSTEDISDSITIKLGEFVLNNTSNYFKYSASNKITNIVANELSIVVRLSTGQSHLTTYKSWYFTSQKSFVRFPRPIEFEGYDDDGYAVRLTRR